MVVGLRGPLRLPIVKGIVLECLLPFLWLWAFVGLREPLELIVLELPLPRPPVCGPSWSLGLQIVEGIVLECPPGCLELDKLRGIGAQGKGIRIPVGRREP